MVAEFSGRSSELIKALDSLPEVWQLTPVNDNKRAYKTDWQKKGLDRKIIKSELKSGKAKGYGLLTGEKSGGILAIDADGPAAQELLAKHGELPATVAFTSGKEGRCQYLLQVPQAFWGILKTIKLNTGVKGENGKDQLLEFRWDGCQSVLPPSVHPETGRYQWVKSPDSVKIAECPNWLFELFMNAEDAAKPEPALPLSYAAQSDSTAASRPDNIPLPVPETIPLDVCLARRSRDLLNGISEGGRNDAGTALARDLIGTANYLNSIGQRFDGDPRMMLEDFAARCSPPLPAREFETIWKSASKANPSPACKSEGVDNCIRGWYWNNYAKKTSGQAIGSSNNVITHPRFAPPDPAELREQITTLINAGTTGSKLTSEIHSLAKGSNPQGIWRIYQEILEEIERADDRLDRKRDIENLLKISNRRLTLENYLHPSLAEPIKKVAKWMGVDPEAVLTHLLPIVAGLINPNSRVVAKECTNFIEPFLIYSGVVALTGARKTPTLNIAKNPLVALQSIEDARYKQALQIYEAELQTLKESKGKGEELPQKPNPPREFYLDNATVESVDKVKGQQPDHGLTLIKDELSGLFASHGAYKGGKGADKESYLSGWNGGGVKKNRAGDGSRVSLAHDSLSITGGIQPDKLRALLGDFSDSQGEWARFLWYHMPMRPYKIPRDDTRYDLGDLLEGIYKKIDALPVLKLHFDKPGQAFWDDWHDRKDEQKRAEARPGLQAAIAKMPGQSVRLIGLLHILWEVASESVDIREEIPLTVVKSGIQLAEFYLGQVTLLQSEGDADTGELSPIFKKLLDKVAEFKSLTARQAIQTIRDLKQIKAPKVREFFTELKAMGLAETQGTGTRMILVQKVLTDSSESQKDQNLYPVGISGNNTLEVLASVDKVLTSKCQSQSQLDSGFQDTKNQTVDTVDGLKTLESSSSLPHHAEPNGLDGHRQIPENSTEVVNTSTLSSQDYIEQAVEGVGTMSTLDVNTSEIANTSPTAPPELETAPTAQAVQSIALLVERVKAAQTWAEVATVWGDDLELKAQIKAQFSKDEIKRIGRLYKQAHPSLTPEPIALTDNSPARESAEALPEVALEPASEPEPATEPASEAAPAPEATTTPPTEPSPVPEVEEEDAEKMRDIALVWWPEMYPEALQSLVTQMFGWGEPARKYSAVQIAQWLQGEDDLVKYRIGELMANGLADNYENDDEEDRGI